MSVVSRRALLASGLAGGAALAAPRFLRALPAATATSSRIYIGTIGTESGVGIHVADWNATDGTIGPLELAAELASPTFLALSRRGGSTFLYAVSEIDSPNAPVTAFAVEPGSRKLRKLNQLETGGSGPTHLSVSPDGRTVVVANYGGGSVTSFHVAADGSLEKAVSHEQYHGSGPYKGRQEAPHTHSAQVTPDGRSVLVNDLGLDRIFVYELDPATSVIRPAQTPFWSAKPGSGPRHIAFSPKGDLIYSTDELTSNVDVLRWNAHARTLTPLASYSTLPQGFTPNTAFVGEVAVSRDGRNVYCGNRVADHTIAVFATDAKNPASLKPLEFASSGGRNCRHITLDPTDRWMVISHQESKDLTVLARDRATGKLSAPVHQYPAPRPMCVVFA
ncbi:lactonase family protein [Terriglobus aquaticus]|uniref:Lactonase family protein n=1 Tax=Terriglobus aquaticus TaxID=940139 RepID=A0ABW9KGZ3_9BACT|nr:lactonase family protein [Terriglobus aquaticus]